MRFRATIVKKNRYWSDSGFQSAIEKFPDDTDSEGRMAIYADKETPAIIAPVGFVGTAKIISTDNNQIVVEAKIVSTPDKNHKWWREFSGNDFVKNPWYIVPKFYASSAYRVNDYWVTDEVDRLRFLHLTQDKRYGDEEPIVEQIF